SGPPLRLDDLRRRLRIGCMRTTRSLAAAAVLAALLAAGAASGAGKTYGANPADLAGKLDRLVRAYPDTPAGVDGDALVLKDGTRLPLSDGKSDKSFDELLNKPDIGDMFAFDYPAGAPAAAPAENFDPGRIRVEALFRALYGDCQKGTLAHQRQVKW